jgi:hypothetical protein
MTTEIRPSREIDGKGRTVRELLANRKYSIDYYQREYKWQTKQLSELMADLSSKFLENYEPTHERSAIDDYGHYFLGSIIISDKDGKKFVIDGQQRLTTLTLMLIYLRHQLADADQKAQLADLIFSLSKGKRSFNLDVPERTSCMEAIFANEEFVLADQQESVANIMARFADLDDLFPDELQGEALPYFCDWLIDNVHLVEITAYSDGDAYTIFETMNDRGLSLTPADMLKGHLLANIDDSNDRLVAGKVWKDRVAALMDLGKDEDADGIKSWLRSQYAASIRDRKKGAAPEDFDLIGTEFHRWVRDNEDRLGLVRSDDFVRFIDRNFLFYGQWYERLRKAANTMTPGLETIYFNAEHNFTLQYPVMLAPINIADGDEVVEKKIKVTAAYLDIMINRRIWNWHATDYSSMQYAMFIVMRDIRGKSLDDLVEFLVKRLADDPERFETNESFRLHGINGRALHRILARMTEYVEVGSGLPTHYTDYAKRGGKDAFEIEHIWADHAERHADEFAHQTEFAEYRNRVGDLLLLPKSFNASYGDITYEEKLPHYLTQNLLAKSLHERAYDHNPGFMKFIERTGLPFKPMPEFKKAQLDARQLLYGKLAELVWNPERLVEIAGSSPV